MKCNSNYLSDSKRHCIRCNTPMINTYVIRPILLVFNTKKIFDFKRKTVQYSICPNCGEISFYVDNPEDITD